jgi:hypothetical protein
VQRDEIHSEFVQRYSSPPLKQPAPVTAADLRAVEKELGTTFPTSYVSFITRYGPIFTPGVSDALGDCEVCVPPQEEAFVVREFLSPSQIVSDYRTCTAGGMPHGIIPFAVDFGGHLFGFGRAVLQPPPDDAPVLAFDHDYCKIRPEADSFDAWLEHFLSFGM